MGFLYIKLYLLSFISIFYQNLYIVIFHSAHGMTLLSVVPLLVDSSIMQRRMLEHILNVAIHSIVEWISWGPITNHVDFTSHPRFLVIVVCQKCIVIISIMYITLTLNNKVC